MSWGTFLEDESKTCTDPRKIEPRFFIQAGDFLLSRANTIKLVGACGIVDQVARRLMLSDKILRLRLLIVPPMWILLTLRSPWGRREIERLATGNQLSMRNISQDSIRSIRIPLPPRREIDYDCDAVAGALEVSRATARLAGSQVVRASHLRQSILKYAFEGRLVPQDPNDEPASVLLERIRVERGAAAETPKPKTKRPRKKAPSA